MALDQRTIETVRQIQSRLQLQPVMFVGSGFTLRYFAGPNWRELLTQIAAKINYEQPIEFLLSKYNNNLPEVGSHLAEPALEWAWKEGRQFFPESFLNNTESKFDAIKFIACDIIRKSIKKTRDKKLIEELYKFSTISPQAVITTNYDECIENILEGYHPIVGKDVYRYRIDSMGEIYKIHGTISHPSSIVLTQEDYITYGQRRHYISAKMMAMFAENPIVIMGYSLADENVTKILCDVGEVIANDNDLIENIIFVQRKTKGLDGTNLPDTLAISSGNRTYYIRRILLDDYLDFFDLLAEPASLSNVKPHILRAFMTRMNRVVRVDIPTKRVEVTYDHIERISSDESEIPKLLGFSISDSANTDHPYTLGQIAEALEFRSESGKASPGQITQRVIRVLKREYGFDIQAEDNKYHCKIKTGNSAKSFTRKYSKLFFDVAKAIKNKTPIQVDATQKTIKILNTSMPL